MTRQQTLAAIRLTPAQVRVLTAMANGSTRREAARQLHLSLDTVASYLKAARYRMDANTTVHAVAIAVAAGVVQVGGESDA